MLNQLAIGVVLAILAGIALYEFVTTLAGAFGINLKRHRGHNRTSGS